MAVSFARANIGVVGYDIDKEKVDALNNGFAPVEETGLQEAISQLNFRVLQATSDPVKAVQNTQACIFVAPTPSLTDGSFDNSYLLAGIEVIASAVGNRPYFFIIASTVTPGSCDTVLFPAIARHNPQGKIIYKPELIALGSVLKDLKSPDVSVMGAQRKEDAVDVFHLYSKMQFSKFMAMSLIEAELAKISLNCAITMKISFANQLAMVADAMGVDASMILTFVGLDSRIGSKSLLPGMPFGGPCFPRDNRMFQFVADKYNVVPHLAEATDSINFDRLHQLVRQVAEDGDVGILGVGYKSFTKVTIESPALELAENLRVLQRTVKVHDPLIPTEHTLEETAACKTVVIALDYPEYRALQFRSDQIVLDPLGILPKENRHAPGHVEDRGARP